MPSKPNVACATLTQTYERRNIYRESHLQEPDMHGTIDRGSVSCFPTTARCRDGKQEPSMPPFRETGRRSPLVEEGSSRSVRCQENPVINSHWTLASCEKLVKSLTVMNEQSRVAGNSDQITVGEGLVGRVAGSRYKDTRKGNEKESNSAKARATTLEFLRRQYRPRFRSTDAWTEKFEVPSYGLCEVSNVDVSYDRARHENHRQRICAEGTSLIHTPPVVFTVESWKRVDLERSKNVSAIKDDRRLTQLLEIWQEILKEYLKNCQSETWVNLSQTHRGLVDKSPFASFSVVGARGIALGQRGKNSSEEEKEDYIEPAAGKRACTSVGAASTDIKRHAPDFLLLEIVFDQREDEEEFRPRWSLLSQILLNEDACSFFDRSKMLTGHFNSQSTDNVELTPDNPQSVSKHGGSGAAF
ncbi:hypothetical protein WN51_10258 [Melipona quadrifasciata]|uniref:Uncharacterized protein n=1 Tax=Melipona quadrifasciata TaxID=166423 RepID=A0A0N0BI49_9HYME|nr:hypothetical protein WN51_10258 [Melipona quadrifasciata]